MGLELISTIDQRNLKEKKKPIDTRDFFLNNEHLISVKIKTKLYESGLISEIDVKEETEEEKWLKILNRNPERIQEIENPSIKLQEFIIERGTSYYHLIKNIDINVVKKAIRKDSSIIRFFENPSLELQNCALEGSYNQGFQYIKNPDQSIIDKALDMKAENIQYVKEEDLTKERIEKAIGKDPKVIKYIKNASDDMKYLAIDLRSQSIIDIINPTEGMVIKALKMDPRLISSILARFGNKREHKIIALQLDGMLLSDIRDIDIELVKIAIDQNPLAYYKVEGRIKLPIDILYYAIDKDPHIICKSAKEEAQSWYWRTFSKKIQMYALKKDWTIMLDLEDIKITPEEFEKEYMIQELSNPK